MAGTSICPSASALIHAIRENAPDMAPDLAALAQAHSDFVCMVNKFAYARASANPVGADKHARDAALAITKSEEAFAWALKGIADSVLPREGGACGGGVLPPCDTEA